MKDREVIIALQLVLKGAGLYTGEIDGIWGPKCQAALDKLTKPEVETQSGKGSWYSQFAGANIYKIPVSAGAKYNWIDKGDGKWNADKTIYLGPNNAFGVPDDQQGIALYDRKTLGDWFIVTAQNNESLKLQQTDIGPHPRTGRMIDIAAVAAERFGYSPKNFPTDSIFTWKAA